MSISAGERFPPSPDVGTWSSLRVGDDHLDLLVGHQPRIALVREIARVGTPFRTVGHQEQDVTQYFDCMKRFAGSGRMSVGFLI